VGLLVGFAVVGVVALVAVLRRRFARGGETTATEGSPEHGESA
jgi:hypothetical protein